MLRFSRFSPVLQRGAVVTLAILAFAWLGTAYADGGGFDKKGCSFKGHKLYGKIEVVKAFPDVRVQVVTAFPDVRVEKVKAFPDSCGKWELVTAFPDTKVQFVDAFPDVKVEYVTAFPGIP